MFDNIGGKIKGLAKVLCWVGIIFSVISGIVTMVAGANVRGAGGVGIFGGLLTIAIGCVLSWIGSFFTYGFGQLIENTDFIRDSLSAGQQRLNNPGNSFNYKRPEE